MAVVKRICFEITFVTLLIVLMPIHFIQAICMLIIEVAKVYPPVIYNMHFPIMCVHTTHLELIELKKEYKERICELPFWHNDHNPQSKKIWSVWGGSQRLNIAKYLGYTHIDAAVLPTVKKAISHQKDMRKPYQKRYYE
jgi:hypothetical protein